jgi:hypothetical protein
MIGQDIFATLYVVSAILLQGMLALYFATRKWRFATAVRFGWIIYALGVPAAVLSVALLIAGKAWYFWIAGFLYTAWAAFGYVVDIARPVEWRSPIRWPVLLPYLVFYMGCQMFFWWPVARIGRAYWYVCAVLFTISTVLNLASHPRPQPSVKTRQA